VLFFPALVSYRKLTMQTGEGEIVDASHIEAKGFGFIKPDTGETFHDWRDRVAPTHN
jgi:hypothetical protein